MNLRQRQRLVDNRLGRREFLGRAGLFAGAVALGPGILAACGGDDDNKGGGGTNAKRKLTVSNWPLYIDDQTVKLFEEKTGIATKYTEDYNDNTEYFAKIQPDLSVGHKIAPDIIVPTFWLTARLIGLGWLEELPLDQIPNVANLVPSLQNPDWDPDGTYSLPWQSGMTGIAYNRKVAGRDLTSLDDLFDPAFKGKIGMLTEMRDTVGLVMLSTGKQPEDATFDAAQEAFDKIEKAKNDGQIRQFTGNDYQDDLVAGNFAACIGWSGDVAQLALENADLKFSIPDEGGMRWSDTMVIPKGAANIEAAAAWMDFVYDPANAARITASVQYVSPVAGVQDELRKMGGDAVVLADSALLFPDDATNARLHTFRNLSEEEEAKFDERFAGITGA